MGEVCERLSGSLSDRSSSACSGILGSIARPLQETGYDSSIAVRRGLRLRPALSGEAGRRGFVWYWPGVMNLPLASRPGDECALCIGGGVRPVEICGCAIGVREDWFCELTGAWCKMGVVGMFDPLLYRSVSADLNGSDTEL